MNTTTTGESMKKLLLFLLTALFASLPLHAQSKYESAIALGKKENKNVIFMITTNGCPWCRKQKKSVLPLPEVQMLLDSYIFQELNQHDDEYPEMLYTRLVPSFFTINPHSGELINEGIGFQPRDQFIDYLRSDIESSQE